MRAERKLSTSTLKPDLGNANVGKQGEYRIYKAQLVYG